MSTNWMVLLYSDGIRARDLDAQVVPGELAEDLAQRILADRARPTDDATIVVLIGEPGESSADAGRTGIPADR